jgi:hypothetical protein
MYKYGVESMIGRKKQVPLGDGTCLWVNDVGGMEERVFKIISQPSDKEVIIGFSPQESYRIQKRHIRAKRVIMFKTSKGQVISQNPDNWANINLESEGIKILRFNLQNFGLQESKAAQHRWTVPLSKMDKLMPLFKLLFICIAVGIIGWSAFKFSTFLFSKVTASGLMDCAQLVPQLPFPIGVNQTIPLGA